MIAADYIQVGDLDNFAYISVDCMVVGSECVLVAVAGCILGMVALVFAAGCMADIYRLAVGDRYMRMDADTCRLHQADSWFLAVAEDFLMF